MANKEFIKETLEHYKQQKQAKLEEVRALDIVIRQLQTDLGEAPEPQFEPAASSNVLTEINQTKAQLVGGFYKPRPDEFFGMAQAEAARAYLEKIGHAVLLEDLFKAVTSGGCKVGGADPKKNFNVALLQNKRDFVPTGNGHFGLRKFYPNMPKLGRPEGKPVVPKKAKRGSKKSAKATSKSKALNRAEVRAAVSEALGDHKLKTPEEVLKSVEQKFGHPVKKIAVYGALRKKENFEQVGDKYRLRQATEASQVIQ